MKNKTKILFGSALATTVGVVTPLVTIVSCSKDKKDAAPIVIEEKVKEINGITSVTFEAKLAKPIDGEKETIVGNVKTESAPEGWEIGNLTPLSISADQVIFECRFNQIENMPPHDGDQFKFNVNFVCENSETGKSWEHTINGFVVTFKCGQGHLQPMPQDKIVPSLARQGKAILEFNLNDTVVPNEFEFDFINVRTGTKEGITDIAIDKSKPYEIKKNLLYVYVDLKLDTTKKPEDLDGASILFDLRISGKDENEKYIWDQTITGFNVYYTIELIVPSSSTKVIPSSEVEAGSLTDTNPYKYQITFYAWKDLKANNIKSIAAESKNHNFDVKLGTPEIVEQAELDYNILNIDAEIKPASGTSVDDLSDQWVGFDINVSYQNFAIPYNDEKHEGFQFPFIRPKAQKVVTSTQILKTEPGKTEGKFAITPEDFSLPVSAGFTEVEDVTATVEISQEEESTANVAYTGAESIPVDLPKEPRYLPFTILSKSANPLNHFDKALFNIVLIGRDKNKNPVWKQTITANEGKYLQLIYRDVPKLLNPNLVTDFNKTTAMWAFSVPKGYTITGGDLTIFGGDQSTINAEIGEGSMSGDEYHVPVTVSAESSSEKMPYNGIANGQIKLLGTDDDGKALNLSVTPCSVAYNGAVVFNEESPEKTTELGKASANFKFLAQCHHKEVKGETLKWTISKEEGSTEGVSIKQSTGSFKIEDGFDGNIDVPVELVRNDGPLVNNDEYKFNITFEIGGKYKIQLKEIFSLKYNGYITKGPTTPITTDAGEDTADFAFESKEVIPTDVKVYIPEAPVYGKTFAKCDSFIRSEDGKKITAKVKIANEQRALTDNEKVSFTMVFSSQSTQWTERYTNGNNKLVIIYSAAKMEGTDIDKSAPVNTQDHSLSLSQNFTFAKKDGSSFVKGDSIAFKVESCSSEIIAPILEQATFDISSEQPDISVPIHLQTKNADGLKIGDEITFAMRASFKGASGEIWSQVIDGCHFAVIDASHVMLKSKPNIKVTPNTPAETPTSFLTFDIIGEWQDGYKLSAVVSNQKQIAGYPLGSNIARVEDEIADDINVTNHVATVPITFRAGYLYGDETNPEIDTTVQFNLTITCKNASDEVVWTTSQESLKDQKFTIAYEYSPWDSTAEITGDEEPVYPSTLQFTTEHNLIFADDVDTSALPDPNIIILFSMNEQGHIISTPDAIAKSAEIITEEGLVKLTITWDSTNWLGGEISRKFYVSIGFYEPSVVAYSFLHWDMVDMTFEM